jgi:5-formyltetrahydrofolate cyclo-ligase
MKKQELRALYKQKRKDLTEIQIKGLQENIYQQIYNLDLSTVKMCMYSFQYRSSKR